MAIILSDNIQVNLGKPVENKYLQPTLNRPYTGISEVNSTIIQALRHTGLTVNINGEEYWYKNGITNGDLIIKSSSVGTTASGERIEKRFTQTSHGFALGNVIGYSASTFVKAIAKTDFNGEVLGIVSNVDSSSGFTLTFAGYVTGLTGTGFNANTTYFLSDISAGDYVTAAPIAAGSVIKPMLATFSNPDQVIVFQYLPVATSTGTTGGGSSGVTLGYNLGGGDEVFVDITNSGTTMNFRTISGSGGIETYQIGNVILISGATNNTLTANNGLTLNGNTISLGGTLTGNTSIETTSNFGIALGQSNIGLGGVVGGSLATGAATTAHTASLTTGYGTFAGFASFAGGNFSRATGQMSFAHGYYACATGTTSTAIGFRAKACGGRSIALGYQANAHEYASTAIGNVNANGIYSFAAGRFSTAGDWGISMGDCVHATGTRSVALGYAACSIGNCSTAIGSQVRTSSPFSAVLGGTNNTIQTGNTGAVLIGGTGYTLTANTYANFVAVPNLAIYTTPATSTCTSVLVWDSVDKKVKVNNSISGGSGGSITTASNGLSVSGTTVVLGGTLTGNTTVNTNNFGIVIGSGSTASGCNSIAFGRCSRAFGTDSVAFAGGIASGNTTFAVGFFSCSICDLSTTFVNGKATGLGAFAIQGNARGTYSISIGPGNACGANSFAFSSGVASGNCTIAGGLFSCAIGINSVAFAGGMSCGYRSTAFGFLNTICSPNTSSLGGRYNHIKNNNDQSVVLGGINNTINSGNTNSAIVGGNNITLSANNYPNFVAVPNLAIFDTPSASTCTSILVWDTADKKVKLNSSVVGGITTANNGLSVNGTTVKIGGYLCENTLINGGLYGLGIGECISASNNSLIVGVADFSSGIISNNIGSVAFGSVEGATSKICSTSFGSIAAGSANQAVGYYASSSCINASGIGSFAMGHTYGYITPTSINASGKGSFAMGYSRGNGIISSGIASFSFGSNINNSANCAIALGCGITLTSPTHDITTAVNKLVIWNSPDASTCTSVLVWDSVDKKVKVNSSITGGGSGATAANNGIVLNGNTVSLGGSLTGDTRICNNTYNLSFSNNNAIGGSALSMMGTACASGSSAIAIGNTTFACGNQAIVVGNNNAFAKGDFAMGIGRYAQASGYSTQAIGYNVQTTGCYSVGVGSKLSSLGYCQVAFGLGVGVGFGEPTSNGCYNSVVGVGSKIYRDSIGSTLIGFNSSIGSTSVINVKCSIGLGSDVKVESNRSIAIGNQLIITSGTTGATLIGGAPKTVSASTYNDYTITDNLAIWSTPITSTGTSVLVWDSVDKKVKVNASITGGSSGGITTASNGLSIVSGNTVVLGGTLTGNTTINTNNFGIAFGSGVTATTNSIALGSPNISSCIKSTGIGSFAMGQTKLTGLICAHGIGSHAMGYSNGDGKICSVGNGSMAIGITSSSGRTISSGFGSIAGGYASGTGLICAQGIGSIAMGLLGVNSSCMIAAGNGSIVMGFSDGSGGMICSQGIGSMAIGVSSNSSNKIIACCTSFAMGCNNIIATGNTSLAFGSNITNCANCSHAFGYNITLDNSTYSGTTAVNKLAIFSTPATSSCVSALVWDSTDKKVKLNSSLGSSGSSSSNVYTITGVSASTTATTTQYVIVVNTSGATGGTITITLPASPVTGQAYKIKDKGNGGANNITISGNGKNIDGSGTALINTNYGALEVVYSGTEWLVLSVA